MTMTLTKVRQYNLGAGKVEIILLAAGPTSYDATNGSAMDVSAYVTNIDNVVFGGVTAASDALIYPVFVNDDYNDADGGAVYFTWNDDSTSGVFENVANTTNLSGYEWRVTLTGSIVER